MSNHDVHFPHTYYSVSMNSMHNSHELAEIVHDITLCITTPLSFLFLYMCKSLKLFILSNNGSAGRNG